MEEIEMINYEGVCRFCGEVVPCLAVDQEDANLKAEEKCTCGGLENERKHKRMEKHIEELFSSECVKNGYIPVNEEKFKFIKIAGEMVFNEEIKNITMDLDGSKGKISFTSQGAIKIERSISRKTQLEG